MPSDETNRILNRLRGVKKSGNGWVALCPGHQDTAQSLHISLSDDGKILMLCFAGCTTENVVAALGLRMRDLFPPAPRQNSRPAGRKKTVTVTVAELASAKSLPFEFLKSLGLTDTSEGILIPYLLEDGTTGKRNRIRSALKAGDGSWWTPGRGHPVPYGLWKADDAIRSGYQILVEGESDSWTLWFHSFPALGIPGAKLTKLLQHDHISQIPRVYVFQEPDHGGREFVRGIYARFREIGWEGEALIIRLRGAKDPSELHCQDPVGFKARFEAALQNAEIASVPADDVEWESSDRRYFIRDNRFFKITDTSRGPVESPLSNFSAEIVEDVLHDDGLDQTRHFVLDGRLQNGQSLLRCEVSATQLDTFTWLSKQWGVGPAILPRQKEHLAYALRLRSEGASRRTIYSHIGWRQINSTWSYLHAVGAIGASNVSVDLARDGLESYALPNDPGDVRAAMEVSLAILSVAPPKIAYVSFALPWRAILCEFLPCTVGLHFVGGTGDLKSTLATLLVAHHGNFRTKEDLPARWEFTDNILEKMSFLVKDAILVIDDLNPERTRLRKDELDRRFSRIVGSVGNFTGRRRMGSDLRTRLEYKPRGIALSTGEYTPTIAMSRLARTFPVAFEKGDVRLDVLTELQRRSPQLPYATRGFIEFMLADMVGWRSRATEHFTFLRDRASLLRSYHSRLPENVAHLYLGLEFGLGFARQRRVIEEADLKAHLDLGWSTFIQLAEDHGRILGQEKPSQAFLMAIREALASGRAWLADRGSGQLIAGRSGTGSEKLGWADEDGVYLLPATAFRFAEQRLDYRGGVQISEVQLHHMLEAEKLLVREPSEPDRMTPNRWCEGKSQRVLWLKSDAFGELPQGLSRTASCWKCGNHLSEDAEEKCPSCGWMVCPCGACGCNSSGQAFDAYSPKPGRAGMAANDTVRSVP